jgi:hypothetical protein
MTSAKKSNIDALIEKPESTLEQLLLDSELLTECKWGNQKLIN